MAEGLTSTGRGGAGNIGHDKTVYVEGDIVREGIQGESDRPEYSSGRGGAGNMVGSPRSGTPVNVPVSRDVSVPATAAGRRASTPLGPGSEDIIPEPAMRSGEGYENFHTGRGGEGNIHKEKYGGHSGPGFLEKAKHAIGLDKKKDSDSPLKQETGSK